MKVIFPLLFLFLLTACTDSPDEKKNRAQHKPNPNPPAYGFLINQSDSMAIALADEVMVAMGGRNAWDETRYIHWNFFNSRKHTWDKQKNIAKIQSLKEDFRAIVDLDSLSGRVWKDGKELTQPDSLQKYLQRAKSMWINDSYWLVMPFKLKDAGVRLTYVGVDTTLAGEASDVIKLGFQGVGDTPQNEYHIYISKEEKLVKQWDFFPRANMKKPQFSTPWDKYEQQGKILLSGGRGKGELTEIKVFPKLPRSVFETL